MVKVKFVLPQIMASENLYSRVFAHQAECHLHCANATAHHDNVPRPVRAPRKIAREHMVDSLVVLRCPSGPTEFGAWPQGQDNSSARQYAPTFGLYNDTVASDVARHGQATHMHSGQLVAVDDPLGVFIEERQRWPLLACWRQPCRPMALHVPAQGVGMHREIVEPRGTQVRHTRRPCRCMPAFKEGSSWIEDSQAFEARLILRQESGRDVHAMDATANNQPVEWFTDHAR